MSASVPGGGRDVRSHLPLHHALHADPAAAIPLSWPRATAGAGHFWVPMDDENCMVWNWMYSWGDAPFTDEERLERASGNGPDHVDPRTFRSKVNRRNGWLIDRQVQKTETFTGIEGINAQDRGVQESMGPIVDRSKEYLGTSRPRHHRHTPSAAAGCQNGRRWRRSSRCRHQLLSSPRRRAHSPQGRRMARRAVVGDVSGGGADGGSALTTTRDSLTAIGRRSVSLSPP